MDTPPPRGGTDGRGFSSPVLHPSLPGSFLWRDGRPRRAAYLGAVRRAQIVICARLRVAFAGFVSADLHPDGPQNKADKDERGRLSTVLSAASQLGMSYRSKSSR